MVFGQCCCAYKVVICFTFVFIGFEAEADNGECLVKSVGLDNIYDSAQVIVVRANGWEMTPKRINIDDIDSSDRLPPTSAWRESGAVFGFRGDQLVVPKVTIPDDSFLRVEEFTFPESSFDQIGMSRREEAKIMGVRFAPSDERLLYNCPDDPRVPEAALCRSENVFDSSVDTLVFVYGVGKFLTDDYQVVEGFFGNSEWDR